MSQSLNIQEFAVAIAAKRHNPTILTPDFLKYSGIVPGDWELAQQPVLTNSGAQVVFQNGISIIAQVNQITFVEAIATKEPKEIEIPAIARKYIETLAQVDYQGVGINFRGHVLFDKENQAARNYMFEKLLSPGAWQQFGKAPVQAAMRFVYTLEESQLYLDVNEVGVRLPEQEIIPAIMFSGNFSHAIAQADASQKLFNLTQAIGNWQKDLDIYKEVVNTKFFNSDNYQPLNIMPGESVISPAEVA